MIIREVARHNTYIFSKYENSVIKYIIYLGVTIVIEVMNHGKQTS